MPWLGEIRSALAETRTANHPHQAFDRLLCSPTLEPRFPAFPKKQNPEFCPTDAPRIDFIPDYSNHGTVRNTRLSSWQTDFESTLMRFLVWRIVASFTIVRGFSACALDASQNCQRSGQAQTIKNADETAARGLQLSFMTAIT